MITGVYYRGGAVKMQEVRVRYQRCGDLWEKGVDFIGRGGILEHVQMTMSKLSAQLAL
jgi:hypothetical protein